MAKSNVAVRSAKRESLPHKPNPIALLGPDALEELASRGLKAQEAVDGEVEKFRENFDGAKNGKRPRGVQTAELLLIPLGKIDETPDNARKTFDQVKLQAFAAYLKQNGTDYSPCLVRPNGDRYTLVYGARRLRASKMAGLSSLKCELDDMSDADAREQGVLENLMREDLNPIERAIAFKQLLDDGQTQAEVAKLLGISQPEVSNTVRVLELPESLQAKVVEGALSPSHAISLITHCRNKGFEAVFLDVAKKRKWTLPPVKTDSWEWMLDDVYDDQAFEGVPFGSKKFLPLAKQNAEALGLFEHPGQKGTWLFTNHKLWEKIAAPLEKELHAKADRRDQADAKREQANQKTLTPAELKARKKKKAEQDRKRVERWFTAWQQKRIGERLADRTWVAPGTMGRLVLFFALRGRDCAADLTKLDGRPVALSKGQYYAHVIRFASLSDVADGKLDSVERGLLQHWTSQETDGYHARLDPEDVRAISREMKIDVAKEWRLDETFLQLSTKDQLADLHREWKLLWTHKDTLQSVKRSELIKELLRDNVNKRLPAPAMLIELAKAKS